MPAWATFAGFAFVVTAGLLLLSHASRGAFPDDESARSADADGVRSTDDARPIDSVDHADRTAAVDGVDAARSPGDDAPTQPAGESSRATPKNAPTSERPSTTSEIHQTPPKLSTAALLANVAVSQGLFGVLLLAGAWYTEIPARAFGVGPETIGIGAVALGVAFGGALYAANEAVAAVGARFGLGGGERLRRALAPETLLGWATLLLVVLPVIAGFEELLFRGALVGVLSAGFDVSPWLLAALSSVAFALGHGAQGRLGVAVTGALGFALAAGYVVTGSLLVVAVAHYLVNALEFLVHEGLGIEWPPESG